MSRHMKEEDELISMIRSFISGHSDNGYVPMSVREAFAVAQQLLAEHYSHSPSVGAHPNPSPRAALARSSLRKHCPSIGHIFLRLDLLTALDEYDAGSHITKRRFVPPTFREVREILNLACVHAVAGPLRLMTLDADDTIYSDGGTLSMDSPMIPLICKFLRMGIHGEGRSSPGAPQTMDGWLLIGLRRRARSLFLFITAAYLRHPPAWPCHGLFAAVLTAVALVTAAAYPGEPHKMETRISGLLRSLAFAVECGAPVDIVSRFHGGEGGWGVLPVDIHS